jgi:hypothetical protein
VNFLCPYCDGALPPPTRKRLCPHCHRIIFARSRPNQPKQWIKEEDLPTILKEWADYMTQRDTEKRQKTGEITLHLARNNIREWAQAGVVKSVKLFTAEDDGVCDICRSFAGKHPFNTPEEISFVMDNAKVRECKNISCRCYWRPEDISLS